MERAKSLVFGVGSFGILSLSHFAVYDWKKIQPGKTKIASTMPECLANSTRNSWKKPTRKKSCLI
jgi:hypothetical protein